MARYDPNHRQRDTRTRTGACPILEVDEDYLDVFQIGLVEGRKFDPIAFPTDTSKAFIINQTAVARLGWVVPLHSFEWLIG